MNIISVGHNSGILLRSSWCTSALCCVFVSLAEFSTLAIFVPRYDDVSQWPGGFSAGISQPTVGDRETWASLPVPFWRVSLAALSSREPGERLGDQGEPEVSQG